MPQLTPLLLMYWRCAAALEHSASPLLLLGLRIYLGYFVFFKAGLTKIGIWDSTLWLFGAESWQEAVDFGNYHVPLLPTELAAVLGTATELLIPPLLILGLLGGLWALVLLLFNAVAVAAFPALYHPELTAGFYDHMFWGVLLLMLVICGPGKYSLDTLLENRLKHPPTD